MLQATIESDESTDCFFLPYKSLSDQIWPCRKISQGQLGVGGAGEVGAGGGGLHLNNR